MPWQLSVNEAFGADLERFGPRPDAQHDVIEMGDNGEYAFAMKATTFVDGTPALMPLDPMWGFASPLVAKPIALDLAAEHFARALHEEPRWQLAFVAGVEASSDLDEFLLWHLQTAFSGHARLVAGEETIRCVASLADGIDGFLANRSREFRRNTRQAKRRLEQSDVYIRSLPIGEPSNGASIARHDIIDLMLAVENRSWKGRADSGMSTPEMQSLYRRLLARLPDHSIRFSAAYHNELPIGFVLGGVLGGMLGGESGGVLEGSYRGSQTYRGLQISFDDNYRDLSVGTLLQMHEIERLCTQGVALYDLGMDMEYKHRWAEGRFQTRPIIVVRN